MFDGETKIFNKFFNNFRNFEIALEEANREKTISNNETVYTEEDADELMKDSILSENLGIDLNSPITTSKEGDLTMKVNMNKVKSILHIIHPTNQLQLEKMDDVIDSERLYQIRGDVFDIANFSHNFQSQGIDIFRDMYKHNFNKSVG